MAFWSSTTLDPKRQFKFSVTFGRLGSNESTFLAQSADRPQFKVSDGTKVDFLDKSFHFPGKVTWEPIKIKFVDVNGAGNASVDSYRYLVGAGWVSPSKVDVTKVVGASFKSISKFTANNQVKGNSGDVTIRTLDAGGNAIDTWTINNAFITAVVLNNLDYAQEGILTAEYTFRYDWASLNGLDT